jgi:hypothetical protein
VALLSFLRRRGHDAERVVSGSSDGANAARARIEKRVLVTLDKDFLSPLGYPPAENTIVIIRIHPPFAPALMDGLKKLLDDLPRERWTGIIVLDKNGHLHLPG